VPIGEAAERLGLNVDAVRKRIKRGTLPAYKEDDRWFVVLPAGQTGVLPGVQPVPSSPTGSRVQPDDRDPAEPIEAAYRVAGEAAAEVALVPLATMVEELRGLADQLADLGRRNEGLALEVGTLRERQVGQERQLAAKDETIAAKDETITDLRAELRRHADLRRVAAAQAMPEAPGSTVAPTSGNPNPAPAAGFWARVRGFFDGR